jgi:hypothetical protein
MNAFIIGIFPSALAHFPGENTSLALEWVSERVRLVPHSTLGLLRADKKKHRTSYKWRLNISFI